ncbi:MAG TPA: [FeFe] hydrogenase H-cluster maturation GTPase HydF [Epulopiscium sp.]|nr:[FeFe] hydrogenase H-cluster maturation GTPase HydF [Candidatus Epulonipiscium sp.]
MEKTPIASRLHVGIFGKTNAGKSSLFNAIFGQDVVIVSEHKGTTTDPIVKAMELNPFGPIALIDTAGLDDDTVMGESRVGKTKDILGRIDFAIYATDIRVFDEVAYLEMVLQFKKNKISHILVFTKEDQVTSFKKQAIKKTYKDAVFTSTHDPSSINTLKLIIGKRLQNLKTKDEPLIGDLLPEKSTVVMVVPLDEAAPKGRLILPQVQFIRECLDYGIQCLVTRETELAEALKNLKKVDLVVTDSQVFGIVNKIVPKEIPLTSFSMLLARQKGDIDQLIEGVKSLETISDNGRILMAEGCSHSDTHEDIGRVKIPNLIKKYTGKQLKFDFCSGYDFPKDLKAYDLVVHCGGCMLNKKSVLTRLWVCEEIEVPVTNYGVALAYLNGILPRSSEIFKLGYEVEGHD